MLYIHTEQPENTIILVSSIFNSYKKKDWFNDPLVKDIIMGIDKTKAVKDEYLESPVFGGMAPERLSSGCKAVIMMYMLDRPVLSTACGDNCAEWILKVADRKDVHLFARHCMEFPDKMCATFVESGLVVNSDYDFAREYYRIMHSKYDKNYKSEN